MEKKKKLSFWHPAYSVVFAYMSIIIMGMTIASYPSSLYLAPMAEDFGVSQSVLQLRMTICSLCAVLTLPFVNKLYQKFSFKSVTVAGAIFFSLGYMGYGFAPNIVVYLLCGIPHGIGNALCMYVAGPYMINAWFNKGAAIAMLIGQLPSTIIATFTTPMIGQMIASRGWRFTQIITAFIGMVLAAGVCLIFANASPEAKGQRPFGWTADAAASGSGALTVRGVSEKNAKRSPTLYMFMFAAMTCILFSCNMRFTSPLAISAGFTAEQGAQAASLYTTGASITLIFAAFGVEKLGVKRYSLIGAGVNILALLLLLFNGGNYLLFSAGIFLCALNGLQYVSTLAVKDVYGMLDFPAISAIINIGYNLCNMVGPTAYGYVYDVTGSYSLMLWVQVTALALSMLCVLMIYRKKDSLPWEERTVTPTAK